MQSKLRKFLSINIFNILLVLLTGSVAAFPNSERLPADPSALTEPPLSILSDQPEAIVVDDDNRFVFFATGSTISRFDLASWSLASEQIAELSGSTDIEGDPDEGGSILGLEISQSQLFAAQNDGDLLVFDLNDLSESPLLFHISDTELGKIVRNPAGTGDNDKLYIMDQGGDRILVYDISEQAVTLTILLQDDLGGSVNPTDMVLISRTAATDTLYVASDDGFLFVIEEGSSIATRIEASFSDGDNLVALTQVPDEELILILNQTDSLIQIFETVTNTEVALVDVPVDLADVNGTPRDIIVTNVTDPTDIYAYVAGPDGLSIVDLDIVAGGLTDVDILDMVTDGDDDDPLPLANGRSPNQLINLDGDYVLTVNGDSTFSVISDNPFVTITAISLEDNSLAEGDTFTLTFESDEIGDFSVRVGGTISADGSEILTGTVAEANTSVTTGEISQNDNFVEGENEIFVFVTDAEGNRGHDMATVTVNTPPPLVTITSTGFGDQRAFINFERLTTSDIASYNLYAATDAVTVLSKTEADSSVAQESSGDILQGVITGLTNETTYFVAIEAVDTSGLVGARNGFLSNGELATVIPQATIGITGRAGETGCSLLSEPASFSGFGLLLLLVALINLSLLRVKRIGVGLFVLIVCFGATTPAYAKELSPQWFTLEIKVGEFIPFDAVTKNGLSKCCNERFELEFGFLYDSKYGVELGVGFLSEDRDAVGAIAGGQSQDRFNFTLVPMQLNLTYRADFKEDQLLVPYVKVGPDFVFFRENVKGNVTSGLKYGFHGTAGLQILLEFWGEGDAMESMGVNDVYFTIEGEYAWINDFGGVGLDLSGVTVSGGLLFEF